MMRLASSAAESGSNPLRPWAITSAFTNVIKLNSSASSEREDVVFPAPLIPASTTTWGNLVAFMAHEPIITAPTDHPETETAMRYRTALAMLLATASFAPADDWPQWMGP